MPTVTLKGPGAKSGALLEKAHLILSRGESRGNSSSVHTLPSASGKGVLVPCYGCSHDQEQESDSLLRVSQWKLGSAGDGVLEPVFLG